MQCDKWVPYDKAILSVERHRKIQRNVAIASNDDDNYNQNDYDDDESLCKC